MSVRHLIVLLVCQAVLSESGQTQGYFQNPESATYDPVGDRYFVANVGNGRIIQIRPGVDTSIYSSGFWRTMGMFVKDNRLWVCTNASVAVFDLTTNLLTDQFYVPGSVCLNDVAADSSGHLWITDSDASRIYRVTVSDHSVMTVVPYVYWPNGIMYDWANDRVIFCAFGSNAPIRAIDPDDMSVSVLNSTSLTNLDGLTADDSGNVYVSSWGSNTVYKLEGSIQAPPVPLSTDHAGPADIFFCYQTQRLVVPNFHRNTVDFLDCRDPDGDLLPNFKDNCPDVANVDQLDIDNDGVGNACDSCTDTDSDGYGNPGYSANTCAVDNCPTIANPGQQDANHDGVGDACCCVNRAGNVDCDPKDDVDISDLTALIDNLYISLAPLCCPKAANIDGSPDGEADISDLTVLISYLYISFLPPAKCR